MRFSTFGVFAYLVAKLALAYRREVRLARMDFLTALMNRRTFREEAKVLVLARRHRHHTIVVYVDVNDFKTINDRLGHDAGGTLIKTIATALQQDVRSPDFVGRRGGDEFVLLLPETGFGAPQRT